MSTPTGPACGTCDDPAIVHWQRRLLDDEIAVEHAKEKDRRAEVLTRYKQLVASLEGSGNQPPAPPEFGPIPDHADSTTVVYACAQHAIDPEPAARVHQAACAGCDCNPEPPPEPEPDPELPPGW